MPGFFDRIRFRTVKLLYDGFFIAMARDASWQEPLFASIAPAANSRVLNFGPCSASTSRTLAVRFPEANVFGADPNVKAVEKACRIIARRGISNLTMIESPCCGRLPFNAGSFDNVVLVLTLHDHPPDEKLGIAKEMLRVLRHGGTLHIADYDKPVAPGESGVLAFARFISGPTAVEPHVNGSWTEFLAKAGFAGIRRLSSQSIRIGRISVVKARKR